MGMNLHRTSGTANLEVLRPHAGRWSRTLGATACLALIGGGLVGCATSAKTAAEAAQAADSATTSTTGSTTTVTPTTGAPTSPTTGAPAPPTIGISTPPTTGAPPPTTAPPFPKTITVGAITFHVPLSWGVIGGGDAAKPRIAFIGRLAGGAGDQHLRVQTGFTGTVDSLVPKTCLGHPSEAPERVELVESGFKPVGERTAQFRFWRAACPNGDGDNPEEHRAWLLPDSQIAIFEQRHAPEVETVVATAHVA